MFYGPAMSGKSTCWSFLWNLYKDAVSSNAVPMPGSTLFQDYGLFEIGLDEWVVRLNVWTASNQDFYCMTRESVFEGTDGIIFVADSGKDMFQENDKSWRELLSFFRGRLEKAVPVTICLNKRDLKNVVLTEDFQDLFQHSSHTEVFETIATTGQNLQAAFLDNLEKIFRRNHELEPVNEKLLSKIKTQRGIMRYYNAA